MVVKDIAPDAAPWLAEHLRRMGLSDFVAKRGADRTHLIFEKSNGITSGRLASSRGKGARKPSPFGQTPVPCTPFWSFPTDGKRGKNRAKNCFRA